MNRNLFQTLTWTMWLALPATALRFWLVWDQLPVRMATHFDARWHPNGWMPRETAFAIAVGMTAFLLAIFTLVLWMAHRQRATDSSSWIVLAFFYLIIGFVVAVNSKVVSYNLTGGTIDAGWLAALVPVAVVVFIVVYMKLKRGEPLPAAAPIAEEVHDAPILGVLLFLGAGLPALGFAQAGMPAIAAFAVGSALLIVGLAAWMGFKYVFTTKGVEIRTLGFRLRSIPASQIETYDVQPWSIVRGYGIRGVGNRRAYVWGNKVVHIKTKQGEVFLGHSEPEKIMRDLDMVKANYR